MSHSNALRPYSDSFVTASVLIDAFLLRLPIIIYGDNKSRIDIELS